VISQCQSELKIGYQKPVNFIEAGELVISENEDDQALSVLISQIDYIRNLSEVQTADEFHSEIIKILAGLGFTDYALIRKTARGSIETPHTSLPAELFKAYEDAGYCRFDFVMDYIHCGIGEPILLSMITDIIKSSPMKTYTFKKNEEILSLYSDYGVGNAYIIPVRSKRNSVEERGVLSIMSIGMTDAEFRLKAGRYGPILKVLADAISYLSESRFSHIRAENLIKPKPLRLLTEMATHDLSLAEAADSLCISLDTANKHMAIAKQALGTGSQANAVYLAIKKGLIAL